MKAAVLYETGKPLVVENDIEVPDLQAGQVLARIVYSGICRSQLMETRGKRGHDPYLPHLLNTSDFLFQGNVLGELAREQKYGKLPSWSNQTLQPSPRGNLH